MNINLKIATLIISLFYFSSVKAQTISCEELSKITITESNRESLLKKHQNSIFKCAGFSQQDQIDSRMLPLETIAKYGPATDKPSRTIGDLIKELKLMKALPGFDDATLVTTFATTERNNKINIKDKKKHSRPLGVLAVNNGVPPEVLIDFIFSPVCKNLTYQQA